MKWKEYLNSTTYIVAFITIWIFFLLFLLFIRPALGAMLIDRYPKEVTEIYYNWYRMYLNEQQSLVYFRKPVLSDLGIVAVYRYNYGHDDVKLHQEYNKCAIREGWIFDKTLKDNEWLYHKDRLNMVISNIASNMWQVYIFDENYNKTEIFARALHKERKTNPITAE